MSRVGKLPVAIPSEVKFELSDSNFVTVSGKLGELKSKFNELATIKVLENEVLVSPANDTKPARAMWGTVRSLVANMVEGVTQGFKEELEISGVGFRAAIKGSILNLSLGYSHNIKIAIPEDIKVLAPKPTLLEISGIDKQKVGQFVAMVISQRPVEPYKGKGIKKKGQFVIRKEGKKK